MKILFVSRFLPHPQVRDSGGQDTYHYILELSSRHEVSLMAFVPAQEEEAVQEMRRICANVVAIPYRTSALPDRLWRAWWRTVYPKVYGRVFSLSYRRQLQQLIRQHQFDLVIIDGMMAQYGLLVRGTKRVLDEVDIYSTVAYHTYLREYRRLPRLQALIEWMRTYLYEFRYARCYEAVVTRSSKDKIYLQELLPGQPIGILSPWFEGLTDEIRSIPICRPSGNLILFVGAMNTPKNIEAVIHFAHHIFPWIRSQVPDVIFQIVGGSPSAEVQSLATIDGIQVIGAVDDLTPFYRKAAIHVVPLLVGGGIITKTLNGMASGRPTVATSLGIAGTSATPNHDLMVADHPLAFAQAVIHLLQDEDDWLIYANRGREFVTNHYDWEAITRSFESFLQSVVQPKDPSFAKEYPL